MRFLFVIIFFIPSITYASYFKLSSSVSSNNEVRVKDNPGPVTDLENKTFYPIILAYGEEGDGLSWEFEGSFRRNKVDDALATESIIRNIGLNGLFNFGNEVIKPYIGVGAMVGSYSISTIEDSEFGVAGQGFVGISVHIVDNLSLGAEYRYFETIDGPKYDSGVGTEIELEHRQTNLLVHARIDF